VVAVNVGSKLPGSDAAAMKPATQKSEKGVTSRISSFSELRDPRTLVPTPRASVLCATLLSRAEEPLNDARCVDMTLSACETSTTAKWNTRPRWIANRFSTQFQSFSISVFSFLEAEGLHHGEPGGDGGGVGPY